MNQDQVGSLVRSLLKVAGAALAAHGATAAAALVNGEDVSGLVLVIAGLIWSHFNLKGSTTPPADAQKLGLVMGLIGLMGLMGSGCAILDKGADPVVVRAEQTLSIAQVTFDTFLKIDDADRQLMRQKAPEVHAFAEWLRVPTPFTPGSTNIVARWAALVESAELTKLAYKQNRTAENKASLATALAVLEQAMSQTQAQLAELQGQHSQ